MHTTYIFNNNNIYALNIYNHQRKHICTQHTYSNYSRRNVQVKQFNEYFQVSSHDVIHNFNNLD